MTRVMHHTATASARRTTRRQRTVLRHSIAESLWRPLPDDALVSSTLSLPSAQNCRRQPTAARQWIDGSSRHVRFLWRSFRNRDRSAVLQASALLRHVTAFRVSARRRVPFAAAWQQGARRVSTPECCGRGGEARRVPRYHDGRHRAGVDSCTRTRTYTRAPLRARTHAHAHAHATANTHACIHMPHMGARTSAYTRAHTSSLAPITHRSCRSFCGYCTSPLAGASGHASLPRGRGRQRGGCCLR